MIIMGVILLLSFLIGGIPFGYIIASKVSKINIQQHGSGNIGSTNVKRVIGKKYALVTQVLDILKGLIPTLIVMLMIGFDLLVIKLSLNIF